MVKFSKITRTNAEHLAEREELFGGAIHQDRVIKDHDYEAIMAESKRLSACHNETNRKTEQCSSIVDEMALRLEAAMEILDENNDKLIRINDRFNHTRVEPSFLINILSHPATPILGVVLFLGGIALIASGAGHGFGIAMSVAGGILVGAGIANKFGFFSNCSVEFNIICPQLSCS